MSHTHTHTHTHVPFSTYYSTPDPDICIHIKATPSQILKLTWLSYFINNMFIYDTFVTVVFSTDMALWL